MKKIILILFAFVLVAACNSVNCLPKQFTALADKVEKKGESFSEEQWEQISDKLEDLTAIYNENIDKFNADQKKEINTAIGKIQAGIFKAGLNQAAGAINEIVDGAKGFLEGLGGNSDE